MVVAKLLLGQRDIPGLNQLPGLLRIAYYARHLQQRLPGHALGNDIFPDTLLLVRAQQKL